MLTASGQLQPLEGGRTIKKLSAYDLGYRFGDVFHRSIYVPAFRNSRLELFEVFDAPNPNLVTGRRTTSTLPTQALFMLNSPFVHKQAQSTAKRLLALEVASTSERIDEAFLLLLNRHPTDPERNWAADVLDEPADDPAKVTSRRGQRSTKWLGGVNLFNCCSPASITDTCIDHYLNSHQGLLAGATEDPFKLNDTIMLNRRQLLQNTGCGFGALALSAMTSVRPGEAMAGAAGALLPKAPMHQPKAKRVIFILMHGGPSHVDSFDYKPELIARDGQSIDFTGVRFGTFGKKSQRTLMKPLWKFKQYGKSGKWVSELFPEIAVAR